MPDPLLLDMVFPPAGRLVIPTIVRQNSVLLVAFGHRTSYDPATEASVQVVATLASPDLSTVIKGSSDDLPIDYPCDWKAKFILPIAPPLTSKPWKLIVHATKGAGTSPDDRHGVVRAVLFRPCQRIRLPSGLEGPPVITISYPPSGGHVAASFTCYGLVDPTPAQGTTMQGASLVSTNSPNSYVGAAAIVPNGFDWAYSFSNVVPDTYNLSVMASNLGQWGSGGEPVSSP